MDGIDLYYKYQSQIKTADLIEWGSNQLLGKIIRYFTKKNVNHTSGSVLMNIHQDTEIRRYIWEADEAGFHPTLLSKALKDYDGKVYWLQLKPEYDHKRIEIARCALSLEGRRYDYISLIKNSIRPVKINDNNVFCSEAWHIANIEAKLIPKDFNDGYALRPGEFDKTNLYTQPVRIY